MRLIAWTGAALFFLSLVHFLWRYFFTFGAPVPASAPAAAAIAANACLFTVFALHHSVLARTGAKVWITRLLPPELERSAYVWVASLLFLATCWWWQPVPGTLWHVTGAAAWALDLGVAIGLTLTLWSAGMLDMMELAGVRQFLRPRDAGPIRSDGPYGLVRHPIYLGWLFLVWSVPVMNGTRFTFAAISTFYLVVAVPLEERSLVASFGTTYREYQSLVRWRMIPYVY